MTNKEPSTLKKETRHISVLDREIPENELTRSNGNLVAGRIKFLFNNQAKIITAGFVLVLSLFAQMDFAVMSFEIPDFNQLSISEGRIKIDIPRAKGVGRQFYLVINKQRVAFNCGFASADIDCSIKDKSFGSHYQNKIGKVWWYRFDSGLANENILFQLEVEGRLVIDYQKQKEKYLRTKKYYPYIWIVSLFFTAVWFFLLQFTNDPITSKRNEKCM